MLDDDDEPRGIRILTVPARFSQPYAAWVPGRDVIVVAANNREEQLDAIMRLVDRLLRASASRDRTPTRSE